MAGDRRNIFGKGGFTLIEVMFVILIVAILAVMAVNAYVEARWRSLVATQADRVAESLREAKFVALKGDAKQDGVFCHGLRFADGDKVVKVQAPLTAEGICDSFADVGGYDLVFPARLKVEEPLLVYFSPPRGEMKIETAKGLRAEKIDLILQFADGQRSDLRRAIVLDPITGSIVLKSRGNDDK